MPPKSLLIKNGIVVRDAYQGQFTRQNILVENGIIKRISSEAKAPRGASVLDASNQLVIPGFIQAHTHLVQTLFRGIADDLSLLSWLQQHIWPMEAVHSPASVRASANLGILEMTLCGTTSILDMGTVKHTSHLLDAAHESGIRYWGGKCLMDQNGPGLQESTGSALAETKDLMIEWRRKSPRIQYSICPRFAVSCSRKLLEAVADLQQQGNVVHIHASESKEEIALVKKLTKMDNIDYLAQLNLLNSRTAVVHAIHLTNGEIQKIAKSRTPIVHCPSSNLKLASGVAPIDFYLKKKIKIGLGSDGAACNNSLDPFKEMHLAALLQKPMFGPESLPARKAFEIATLGGAQVLGVEDQLGTLEVGKRADIVTVSLNHPGVATVEDPYSALVYSCTGRDVQNVIIDGQCVVKNQTHQILDGPRIIARAKEEKRKLLGRLGPDRK